MLGAVAAGRARVWPALVFAVGCVGGGSLTGVAIALLNVLLAWIPQGFASGIGTAAIVWSLWRHLRHGSDSLPQSRRQIPRKVFDRGVARGLFWFGLEYGSGVRTYVTSSAALVVAVLLLALRPGVSVLLASTASFGLARAIPVIAYGGGRGHLKLLTSDRAERGRRYLGRGFAVAMAGSASVLILT